MSAESSSADLVNQGELARLLGVSARQVRRWEAAGMSRHSGPNPVLYHWPTCRDWWAGSVSAGTRQDPADPDIEGGLDVLPALQDLDADVVEVACWMEPAEVARAFGHSQRHLRRLHKRGLPYDSERGYPAPQAIVWLARYELHVAFGHTVDRLPLAYALLEHALAEAYEFGSDSGQLRIRTRTGQRWRPNI